MLVAPLVVFAVAGQNLHSSAGPVMWNGFNFLPTHLQVFQHSTFALVPAPPLTSVGLLVAVSALVMFGLFLIAFIVLFFGWSRLSAAIARHPTQQRRRTQLLAWAPIFSILIDILMIAAIAIAHPSHYHSAAGGPFIATNGDPTVLHVLDDALPIVAGAGWIIGAACVTLAARRAETEPRDLRYGKSVATIVTSLFMLMALSSIAWGVGLVLQARQAAHGDFTTITYLHPGIWLPMSMLLTAGGILSALGSRAARSSWRAVSVTVE
jgi:magnesium-transporting ATPase (P-type)